MTCTKCGKDKVKNMSHQKAGRTYFVDEAGRQWRRGQCPDCRNAYARKNNEARGVHKPRSKATSAPLIKGYTAELSVIQLLGSLGVSCTTSLAQDPDIELSNGIRIEVKSVTETKNGLMVGAVTPNRRKDDFIAFVYKGAILIEPMEAHLSKCYKNGCRHFPKKAFGG